MKYDFIHIRYTSTNGLDMVGTIGLNWQVKSEYRDGTGDEYFIVTLGGLSDNWSWILNPSTFLLSCVGDGSTLNIQLDSIEEANKIVLGHAKAINHDFGPTIYAGDFMN